MVKTAKLHIKKTSKKSHKMRSKPISKRATMTKPSKTSPINRFMKKIIRPLTVKTINKFDEDLLVFDLNIPIKKKNDSGKDYNNKIKDFADKYVPGWKYGKDKADIYLIKNNLVYPMSINANSKSSLDNKLISIQFIFNIPINEDYLNPMAIDITYDEKSDEYVGYIANIHKYDANFIDAFFHNSSSRVKYNYMAYSGSELVITALNVLYNLGINKVSINDAASIYCGKNESINLSTIKIIETGRGFYNRFGFKYVPDMNNTELSTDAKIETNINKIQDYFKKTTLQSIINIYNDIYDKISGVGYDGVNEDKFNLYYIYAVTENNKKEINHFRKINKSELKLFFRYYNIERNIKKVLTKFKKHGIKDITLDSKLYDVINKISSDHGKNCQVNELFQLFYNSMFYDNFEYILKIKKTSSEEGKEDNFDPTTFNLDNIQSGAVLYKIFIDELKLLSDVRNLRLTIDNLQTIYNIDLNNEVSYNNPIMYINMNHPDCGKYLKYDSKNKPNMSILEKNDNKISNMIYNLITLYNDMSFSPKSGGDPFKKLNSGFTVDNKCNRCNRTNRTIIFIYKNMIYKSILYHYSNNFYNITIYESSESISMSIGNLHRDLYVDKYNKNISKSILKLLDFVMYLYKSVGEKNMEFSMNIDSSEKDTNYILFDIINNNSDPDTNNIRKLLENTPEYDENVAECRKLLLQTKKIKINSDLLPRLEILLKHAKKVFTDKKYIVKCIYNNGRRNMIKLHNDFYDNGEDNKSIDNNSSSSDDNNFDESDKAGQISKLEANIYIKLIEENTQNIRNFINMHPDSNSDNLYSYINHKLINENNGSNITKLLNMLIGRFIGNYNTCYVLFYLGNKNNSESMQITLGYDNEFNGAIGEFVDKSQNLSNIIFNIVI
jgi:hypothetical protein